MLHIWSVVYYFQIPLDPPFSKGEGYRLVLLNYDIREGGRVIFFAVGQLC